MKKIKISLIVLVAVVGLYFLARWYVEKKYEPPRQVQTDLRELEKETAPLKQWEGKGKDKE